MKKLMTTTALILALTLNGAALACPSGSCHRDGPPPHIKEALEKLPAERAELIQSTMAELRENRKAGWESMKNAREEMQALLTAETFDKTAFLEKAGQINESRSRAKLEKQQAIAELASQLNADERKILVDMVQHKRKHHGHKKHGERHSE